MNAPKSKDRVFQEIETEYVTEKSNWKLTERERIREVEGADKDQTLEEDTKSKKQPFRLWLDNVNCDHHTSIYTLYLYIYVSWRVE